MRVSHPLYHGMACSGSHPCAGRRINSGICYIKLNLMANGSPLEFIPSLPRGGDDIGQDPCARGCAPGPRGHIRSLSAIRGAAGIATSMSGTIILLCSRDAGPPDRRPFMLFPGTIMKKISFCPSSFVISPTHQHIMLKTVFRRGRWILYFRDMRQDV